MDPPFRQTDERKSITCMANVKSGLLVKGLEGEFDPAGDAGWIACEGVNIFHDDLEGAVVGGLDGGSQVVAYGVFIEVTLADEGGIGLA